MELHPASIEDLLHHISEGVYFVDKQRRITFWNRGAETISGYSEGDVLGKNCSSNILCHINEQGVGMCHSLCPLGKTLADGVPRKADLYLYHKEGHRLPVSVRILPFRDAEGSITGAAEIFASTAKQHSDDTKMKTLAKMAYYDTVTTLFNRQYAEVKLNTLLTEQHQTGIPFGVLLVNVCQFRRINEQYGHAIGDQMLKTVARSLSNNVGGDDIVARWHGANFIIISPHAKKGLLLLLANKLKLLAEQSYLTVGQDAAKVNVALGGTIAQSYDTVDSLLERAERAVAPSNSSDITILAMGSGE